MGEDGRMGGMVGIGILGYGVQEGVPAKAGRLDALGDRCGNGPDGVGRGPAAMAVSTGCGWLQGRLQMATYRNSAYWGQQIGLVHAFSPRLPVDRLGGGKGSRPPAVQVRSVWLGGSPYCFR